MDMTEKEIDKYIDYLRSQKGLSDNTLTAYKKDLLNFYKYLNAESLDIEKLVRYQFRGFLAELNHNKLSNRSINRILASIKGFIKYKTRFGYNDPASILEVESIKSGKYLPGFLSFKEIEELTGFKCKSREDFRDRAIFELIFSTGIRVSEVTNINLPDIPNKSNEIKVTGKGSKQRIVIFGNRCRNYLNQYIKIRNNFKQKPGCNALFLNKSGTRLTDRGIRYLLDKRVKQLSIVKNISPHSLRHSFATNMIRNGADIRTVQTLLGHASLNTTQIYTHLGIDELKDIHYKYHPHGK